MISLLAVLSVPTYYKEGKSTIQQFAPDGTVIEDTIVEKQNNSIKESGPTNYHLIIIFSIFNIPTIIFLVMYYVCRDNLKRSSLLDKMNKQDLE